MKRVHFALVAGLMATAAAVTALAQPPAPPGPPPVIPGLTTGIAFGALWISAHPGTASMGKLLLISLAYTLGTALFFGPALMGEPPTRKVEEPVL